MLVYQRVSPLVNFSIDPSSHRADALITSQVQNRQDTRRRRRARLPQALRARFHLAQRPRALLLLFLRIGFSSCAVGQPVLLFGHGWDDCGGNQCCTIGSRKLMEMVKWGMFQNARYLSLSNSPTIACNTYISPDQETSKEKTSLDPPDLKSLLAKKKTDQSVTGVAALPNSNHLIFEFGVSTIPYQHTDHLRSENQVLQKIENPDPYRPYRLHSLQGHHVGPSIMRCTAFHR